jgi:hypothetical protein
MTLSLLLLAREYRRRLAGRAPAAPPAVPVAEPAPEP